MASETKPKVLVIGGTGAQGLPVVRGLVQDGKYTCRILTRKTDSARAQYLLSLGNVELFEGSFTDESQLREAYKGCDRAFVNLDGFNVGEKAEGFWAMRAFELAVENGGIQFFVYGNLDYGYKKSGYNPIFRVGHYDGKGRVGEWILSQVRENKGREGIPQMGASLFTTGPYMEMAVSNRTPMAPQIEQDESGTDILTWRVPLTDNGAVVHVALEDCGPYVRWLFDNPELADGLDLEVAIEHMNYHEMARAFTAVTGHPARFVDVDFDTYWASGPMSAAPDRPTGYGVSSNDPGSMKFRDNFTGFWNLWRHSGGNQGVIQRDYKLMDEIHPRRIKTAEEWFRRQDEEGRKAGQGTLWDRVQNERRQYVLKDHEDLLSSRSSSNL